jgi:hypothetical protein
MSLDWTAAIIVAIIVVVMGGIWLAGGIIGRDK